MNRKGRVLKKVDAGKRGARESANKIRIPANTGVVIKVSGHGDSKQPEQYELRWSVEEATGTATTTPTTKKKPPTKKATNDLDDEYGN